MIKAKQNERAVKRVEGDIKKEQRHLRHSLRKFDVGKCKIKLILVFCFYRLDLDTTSKRYNAEKNLSTNLQEKDKIEREFVKSREKVNFYQLLLT
jgi:hypothetical protein